MGPDPGPQMRGAMRGALVRAGLGGAGPDTLRPGTPASSSSESPRRGLPRLPHARPSSPPPAPRTFHHSTARPDVRPPAAAGNSLPARPAVHRPRGGGGRITAGPKGP